MHVTGRQCDQCASSAYWNSTLGACLPCNCSSVGAASHSCNSSGVCLCRPGFQGRHCRSCLPVLRGERCNLCAATYWNYTSALASCQQCSCAALGSLSTSCDAVTGQCSCRAGFASCDCSQCDPAAGTQGLLCDTCQPGFFGFNGSL